MTGNELDRWILTHSDDEILRTFTPGAARVALKRKTFLEQFGIDPVSGSSCTGYQDAPKERTA